MMLLHILTGVTVLDWANALAFNAGKVHKKGDGQKPKQHLTMFQQRPKVENVQHWVIVNAKWMFLLVLWVPAFCDNCTSIMCNDISSGKLTIFNPQETGRLNGCNANSYYHKSSNDNTLSSITGVTGYIPHTLSSLTDGFTWHNIILDRGPQWASQGILPASWYFTQG